LLAKTQALKQKQFSICSKHVTCLDYYHEHLRCSPLALTHSVSSDTTAELHMNDNMVWHRPLSKQLHSVYINSTVTLAKPTEYPSSFYFRQIIVSVLNEFGLKSERYVSLQYIVTFCLL